MITQGKDIIYPPSLLGRNDILPPTHPMPLMQVQGKKKSICTVRWNEERICTV